MFKRKDKKNLNHKNLKYNKKQFIFYGINYLIGYGFIVGLCSAYGNLGLFYLVALMFCGLIIFAVGINYAKIAQMFPNSYGAGYIISKKAFGKIGGFFNGWLQYIQSPIVSLAAVSGIIWSFQNINFFGLNIDKAWLNSYGWILAIASAIIFAALTIILTFGFNATKLALYIFSFLKWSFIFLVVFGAIYLIVEHLITNPMIVINNFTNYVIPKHINFTNILFGTFTIFFSLGGIEGLATINADVEDASKTVPTAIFWTVISTICFYFVFFVITLLALGPYGDRGILPGSLDPYSHVKTNSPNPASFIISSIFVGGFSSFLGLYVVITQISNKCTYRLQSSWVYSRNLISLSANGRLPRSLININLKNNQFSRCIWLDFLISFTVIFIYILIFALEPSHSLSEKLDNSFDAISLQVTILYCYTGLSTLYCYFQRKIKLSKASVVTIMFSTFMTGVLAILFVIFKIISYVNYLNLSDLLSLLLVVTLILLGIIIYIIGELKQWEKSSFPPSWNIFIKDNPDFQFDDIS